MSTLKVGIQVVPIKINKGAERTNAKPRIIEAELLDISARFCRLRIARERFCFDTGEVAIQFAWTDVVARIIWSNTSVDSVEFGLMMPMDASEESSVAPIPEQEVS
jgi:hypothetical protein